MIIVGTAVFSLSLATGLPPVLEAQPNQPEAFVGATQLVPQDQGTQDRRGQRRGQRGRGRGRGRGGQRGGQRRGGNDRTQDPNPLEPVDSVWIENLTYMEVRDLIKAGKTTAIIPTGGIEPNGPYVVTGKHNVVLEAVCEELARELGDALVTPVLKLVPEGSHEPPSGHMRSAGTLSLRQETFEAVLTDVGMSLKAHGFENIIYIGDSGGNQGGQAKVAAALNEKWGESIAHHIPEFYDYGSVGTYMTEELGVVQGESDGFHDSFPITAIMMTRDVSAVRYEQRVKAGKASINGVTVHPKEAAIEIGKKLVAFRVDVTAKAIKAAIAGK